MRRRAAASTGMMPGRQMSRSVIGDAEARKPEAMKGYAEMVAAAERKHGGRYLARGVKPQIPEGRPGHETLIIEFAAELAPRPG